MEATFEDGDDARDGTRAVRPSGSDTAAAAVNMHTIRSARSFIAFPADVDPDDVLPGWIDWVIGAKAIRAALPKSL